MATLTNEQIEQKKQQLKQLAVEVKQLQEELIAAGAMELDENDLDQAAGGQSSYKKTPSLNGTSGNSSEGERMNTNPRPKLY
jgi:hypothetical protein